MHTSYAVFEEMNAYNARVNIDLLQHLADQSTENEKIFKLVSHIVNAHQIWLERIQGIPNSVQVFEIRSLEDLKRQAIANGETTYEILHNRNLEDDIQYTNTKGQKFSNSICQMFLHIFNHSAYHRGQINQLLVQEGKKAMVSDYIFYNRTELI